MGFFKGIGCGQIVVFSGVDDDAGIAVDHAGEVLVDHGPLHVDVPEQDAVQGIVEHDVQPFHGTHGGDFRHAQAGAVVAQAYVAAQLFPYFIQGSPHQAEVLLGGHGSAEAFRSGAVGHIVEQALTGGADDGDDVGALPGCRLGLDDILIDIARGYDQVQVGSGLVAVAVQIVFPDLAVGLDSGNCCLSQGGDGADDVGLGRHRQGSQIQFAPVNGFRDVLGRLAGLNHGVGQIEADAGGQCVFGFQVIHHDIGQRHLVFIDAVDAQQPADGPLHRYGGVTLDEGLGVLGDGPGQGSGLGDGRFI
ncbi:hypothetical protein DSECCO2_337980 [anaerobic digester metagenome]